MRKRNKYGVPLEHQEQANLIAWKFAKMREIPELWLLHAIPNQGVARLKNLQTEGASKGVPDLCLPVARGGFHGLYIELKRVKGGKISPEQYEWMGRLSNEGYRVEVCYGADEARAVILSYLGKEQAE